MSEQDLVNHPPHYTSSGIEVIDYIEDQLSDAEFIGYCKVNALKYISRAGKKKGSAEKVCLGKAAWYINRAVEFIDKLEENS